MGSPSRRIVRNDGVCASASDLRAQSGAVIGAVGEHAIRGVGAEKLDREGRIAPVSGLCDQTPGSAALIDGEVQLGGSSAPA